MGIAVLGPVEVDGQGNGLAPRDRVVLSALVVRGDPMTTEALADALWGDDLPASWAKVVHGCIARLRKRLGAAAIDSGGAGYRLTLTETELDCRRFERLFEGARDALNGDDPERAAYVVQEALDLWRGRALADLEDWEPGRVEAARLEGLRMDAEELRVEAQTRAGHARSVLSDAKALVAEAPYRERRWALLARALHQSGRQAEALAAIRRARELFVDQIGLDPGRELVELEELMLRQDPSLDPVLGREVSALCPYRGLLPYGAEDAESFFGREADVAVCLRKLRDTGLLALVGPSGVGKSSVVRAGVVASLTRDGVAVVVTTPGARPTESLTGLRPGGRQVLVVDQLEEAVTACRDPGERERYFAALETHVAGGGSLVVSLRADHLGDLAPYAGLTRILQKGLHLLGPMGEADLRSAIEGPARRAGLRLEHGLVDLLVRDVEGEPAALPLLSHVLRETWARREGPTLTVDGYLATGGIRDAVSRTAEALYDGMDAERRGLLRSVLLRLVMPTEDGDPVRARVSRARLAVDKPHAGLLEQLVNARLVSIDDDTVQIAHEALVRAWPRLRSWLDDDVEGQRLFRHLAVAADAWDAMGRPGGELYRGTRLARTVEWRDRTQPDLNANERAFLAASGALAESEVRDAEARMLHERRVNRRLRGALATAGVLLVLTMVAGLFAVLAADRAAQQRDMVARERDRTAQAANLAEARRAGAQGVLHEDLTAGLLLAVQGVRADGSTEARENLGSALTRAGALAGLHDLGRALGSPGTAHVSSLAASSDGDLVAGCLWVGGTHLFDARTLEAVPFSDNIRECASLEFSPDGDQLVVAGASYGGFRLYDVRTRKLARTQPGGIPADAGIRYSPANNVDVAFSGDGRRLTAQLHRFLPSEEFARVGRVLVWDTADPAQPVLSLRMPPFSHLALSPRGDRLYVATRGSRPLRVYDVASGRLLAFARDPLLAAYGVQSTALRADGAVLAVAVRNQVVRFDTRTLRRRGAVLTGHTATVHELAYSHGGRLLASSSQDGTVRVWEGRSGAQLHRFSGGGPIAMAFADDDRRLFTTGGAGLIQAWGVDGESRRLVLGEEPGGPERVLDLAVPAPDARTVAHVRSGRLWFDDTLTGRATPPQRTRSPGVEVSWSPDARRLLSVGAEDFTVTVWEAASGEVVARTRRFRPDLGLVLAGFSTDGRHVLVHDGALLHTLSATTLKPVYPAMELPVDAGELVAHPDGSVMVVHRYDGWFVRADPRTGELLGTSEVRLLSGGDVEGRLSPDGTRMMVTGPGVQVRLLDVRTKKYLDSDLDPTFQWGAPAFAPDGSQYASAGQGRLRLWDGRTGRFQGSLPLPSSDGVYAIAYRPDSSSVVIAATDGRTWEARTRVDQWDDRACAVAGRNLTKAEWRQFFPSAPYQRTCPQWPAGT